MVILKAQLRPPLSPPKGEEIEKILVEIIISNKKLLCAVLMKKELMMIWKIKCLAMFDAPPPLFFRRMLRRRGGREVRLGREVRP